MSSSRPSLACSIRMTMLRAMFGTWSACLRQTLTCIKKCLAFNHLAEAPTGRLSLRIRASTSRSTSKRLLERSSSLANQLSPSVSGRKVRTRSVKLLVAKTKRRRRWLTQSLSNKKTPSRPSSIASRPTGRTPSWRTRVSTTFSIRSLTRKSGRKMPTLWVSRHHSKTWPSWPSFSPSSSKLVSLPVLAIQEFQMPPSI